MSKKEKKYAGFSKEELLTKVDMLDTDDQKDVKVHNLLRSDKFKKIGLILLSLLLFAIVFGIVYFISNDNSENLPKTLNYSQIFDVEKNEIGNSDFKINLLQNVFRIEVDQIINNTDYKLGDLIKEEGVNVENVDKFLTEVDISEYVVDVSDNLVLSNRFEEITQYDYLPVGEGINYLLLEGSIWALDYNSISVDLLNFADSYFEKLNVKRDYEVSSINEVRVISDQDVIKISLNVDLSLK